MVKKVDDEEKRRTFIKGIWTAEEDKKLKDYMTLHPKGKTKWKWTSLPALAGLNRCAKSCRLRWLNYLKPGLKKGDITEEEEDIIMRIHNLIGNRWSLIARRLPGRTDNEIKNYWFTNLRKRALTIDELNDQQNKLKLLEDTNIVSSLNTSNAKVDAGISCLLNEQFTFKSMDDLERFLEI